jgi:hypothetical protein
MLVKSNQYFSFRRCCIIVVLFYFIFFEQIVNAQFIQSHPGNIKVCYGVKSSTGIKLIRRNVLDSFRWEFFDVNVNKWAKLNDDSNWKGTNSDTLYFKNSAAVNVKVRCVVDSLRLNQKIFISKEAQVISFNQLNAGQIGFSQNKCFGSTADTIKIRSLATGGDTIVAQKWRIRKLTGSYSTYGSINDKFVALGVLKYSQIVQLSVESKSCGTKFTDSILIKVYDSITNPAITSSQTICYNTQPNKISISVKSRGGLDSFKYLWYTRKLGNSNFSIIDSVNRWQYQPGFLLQTTDFKVVAKSHYGCGYFFSDSMRIRVYGKLSKPLISKSQRICFNKAPSSLKIDSFAKGGNDTFNYQWQLKSISGTWQDISGAINSNYAPSKLKETTLFRLKATSIKNCGIVYSDSITITVLKDLSKPIISQGQIICYGTTPAEIKLDLAAKGGTDTFNNQWQQYTSGSWTNIGILNSNKLNLGNQFSTSLIKLVSTSTNACGEISSDSVKITVYNPLTKPVISQSQVICFDAVPNQIKMISTAIGGNDSFDYQWETKEISSWNVISNERKFDYAPPKLSTTTYYRIVGVSKVGCGTVKSDSLKITVYNQVKNSTIALNNPYGNAICYSRVPGFTISKNASGGDGKFLNTWLYSTDSIVFKSTGDTGTIFKNLGNITFNNGLYYFKVKSENICGTETSAAIRISVLPSINIPNISSNQSVCFGAAPNTIILNSSPSGASGKYEYGWEESTDNIIWNLKNGSKSTSLNPGSLFSNKYYRSIITDSICGDYPTNSVLVNVFKPIQKAQLETLPPFCYRAYNNQKPIKFSVNGGPSGGDGEFSNSIEWSENQLDWQYLKIYDVQGFKEGGLVASRYYRIKSVSNFGCGTVYSDPVLQQVYDSFTAPQIGNLTAKYTICENQFLEKPLEILLKHSNAGTNFRYQWQIKNNSNWVDLQSDTTKIFNRPFYASGTFRLNVLSVQNCGTVNSNEVYINVINRPDTVNISGSSIVCKNAKEQFFEAPYNSNYSYLWSAKIGKVKQGKIGPSVLIDWENVITSIDTIILLRKEQINFCENRMYLPITISTSESPQPASIKKISGTNILVCSDSTPSLIYVWGYMDKKSKIETLETKNGKRYHQYNNTIDTNTNAYFVKTVLGDCITTSYYSTNLWRLDNPNSELGTDMLEVFPNPSITGKFELNNPLIISNSVVYDINGKTVTGAINGNVIDLSNQAPGVYILKVVGINKTIKLINLRP